MSSPAIDYCQTPTVQQFLQDYPEFDTSNQADPSAVNFPQSAINYWLTQATMLLNQNVWGRQFYIASELMTAHFLALEAWSTQGGNQTIPGLSKGMIAGTSSGGDVSVTYNNALSSELDAGHWSNTTYGMRLLRLIRLIVPAGIYVGAGCTPPYANGNFAWSGPWCFNFPNPEM